MKEIIKELKMAKIAYENAMEYDYCRCDNYTYPEKYWGCSPNEIVNDILRLIQNL